LNELPQEIKFTLVFDEEIDTKLMNKAVSQGSGSIPEEEIESDQEQELIDDDEQEALPATAK
jgi:hypothetical protein